MYNNKSMPNMMHDYTKRATYNTMQRKRNFFPPQKHTVFTLVPKFQPNTKTPSCEKMHDESSRWDDKWRNKRAGRKAISKIDLAKREFGAFQEMREKKTRAPNLRIGKYSSSKLHNKKMSNQINNHMRSNNGNKKKCLGRARNTRKHTKTVKTVKNSRL